MSLKGTIFLAILIGSTIYSVVHLISIKGSSVNLKIHLLLFVMGSFVYSMLVLAGFLIDFREILGTKVYFIALAKGTVFGLLMTGLVLLIVFMQKKFLNENVSLPLYSTLFFFLLFSAVPLNGVANPNKKMKSQPNSISDKSPQ